MILQVPLPQHQHNFDIDKLEKCAGAEGEELVIKSLP